jgi:hypothetical protein
MAQDTIKLLSALSRMETIIDLQRGRAGLMQRWLDQENERLNSLAHRIDANFARLKTLLEKQSVPR